MNIEQKQAMEKRLKDIRYEDFEVLIRLGLWALESAIPNLELLIREIEHEQRPQQTPVSTELRRILKSSPPEG